MRGPAQGGSAWRDGPVGLDGREEPYAPGITEQQIAEFHEAMDDRVAEELIIVKDEPTEACTKPRMWRVLVDYEAPTREGAQAWCESNGLPADECKDTWFKDGLHLTEAGKLAYIDAVRRAIEG